MKFEELTVTAIGFLILVVSLLAFLMPFFVLRIRNEMIEMNRKMERLIEAVGGQRKKGWLQSSLDHKQSSESDKQCRQCGLENKEYASECRGCGRTL